MEEYLKHKEERDFDQEIDTLLERFPEGLQQRYEEELETILLKKTPEEQLHYLEEKFSARQKSKNELVQIAEPKHIEVSEIVPQAIEASIERSNKEKTESFLGDGQTAEVLASLRQPTICYKVFYKEQDQIGQNSLVDEIDLQIIAQRTLSEKGLRIPEVHAFIRNHYGDAIMMEKVEGISLKQIMRGQGVVPDNFDIDTFSEKVRNFIIQMNDEGIYHRDLTPGNIMVGDDSEPWIIDFGRSKKSRPRDPDAYKQTNPKDPSQEMVFPNDQTFANQTLQDFREYLGF